MTFPKGLAPTLVVLLVLTLLVAAPLLAIAADTLGSPAWHDALFSRLSRNLTWIPLGNTLLLGLGTALGSVLIGGFLAWLVVLTDVPLRRTLAVLATLPFMIPSFATALAWSSLFRNSRTGGSTGLLAGLGVDSPDWLAWGMIPTLFVLIAQYYALVFTVLSAALAALSGDALEAAVMTGAPRRRILAGIVLPMVTPALLAGASLAFAAAVSNFAAPALMGLPVRMQTLSTRLFGMIEIGQTERGYVLALLLILVSAAFLAAGNRLLAGRRRFATISGKGARRHRMKLGRARWPLCWAALGICFITTLGPILLLVAASLAPQSSALFSDWTLHFWIGAADPGFARGQEGILRNPQIVKALWITLGLGLAVAIAAVAIGLLAAVVLTGPRLRVLTEAVSQLSFLPMLLPGIAFGAAFIAIYGAGIGPLPGLYGTPLLLGLALTAASLPFAVQTGRATVAQISGDIDEAARMTGAGFLHRIGAITLPLAAKGIIAGALLVFVNVVGDLAIVALLYTPDTPVLSVLSYRYASDGFQQFANAITLIILAVSIAATALAQLLKGRRP
ncbi:ABC transporter permease [Alloyangia pacifica]|uniref:Iron(III) transport system permease protein n=1 Tax=Alloyangia pacifica TaxID=311180 RepID=A0A1I6UWV4_9RHOB|nr:iron ABC transporter permease [Alloyangia pacifica]SDI28878.1 iron(III) transport system permease protein [Alloyangia pacifica]SFT05912.1 iron(III) transport system permease protein [Alloyangia pacifica]